MNPRTDFFKLAQEICRPLSREEHQALSEAPQPPRLTDAELDDLHREIVEDRLHRSRLEREYRAAEMQREKREGY